MRSITCSHHPRRAPRAEWLRVLAGYLVAIFLLQGMAAALQWGAGPLHHHREAPVTRASLLFAHPEHAHAHAHAQGERHHHDGSDGSVVAMAESGASDILTSALCSAVTLLAVDKTGFAATLLTTGRHVQQAAPHWAWHTAPVPTMYRPPWLA